jgi:hypothetical protein
MRQQLNKPDGDVGRIRIVWKHFGQVPLVFVAVGQKNLDLTP